MHIVINTAAINNEVVNITDTAANAVRMSFNPSTLPKVDRIKALAAALISEIASVGEENKEVIAESILAKRKIQEGSMWGVFAATSKV